MVKDFAPRAAAGARDLRALADPPRDFGSTDALAGVTPRSRACSAVSTAYAFVVEHRGGARFSRRRPLDLLARLRRGSCGRPSTGFTRGAWCTSICATAATSARHPQGRPGLIDFDAAPVRFRRDSGALLLPALRRIDRRGAWKSGRGRSGTPRRPSCQFPSSWSQLLG